MSYTLSNGIDYEKHNEDVKRVWDAFNQGKPYRVPVLVGGSITNYFLNPELNGKCRMFKDFFEDPEVQINAQLEYQKWCRFNLCCDLPMGIPEDAWLLNVDFQNSFEAAWFGCPLQYWDWRVPDTVEIFKENGELLYEMPELVSYDNGLMSRVIEFYGYMHEKCKELEYMGKPVTMVETITGERTDGIFTLAAKVRGMEELLVDMLTNEKYYHDLMDYLTRSIINRIKRLKEYRWSKYPDSKDIGIYKQKGLIFADDSIMMLSCEQYKEFVYPYHKRFFDEFSDGTPALMHLCGDATRHFRFLKENLNIGTFDTGFPVDHGWLRKELGLDVTIYGGPTIMTVKDGSMKEIEEEVKKICSSGIMEGGKYILTAANNMAPCTPVENVMCLYESGKKYGRYL